MSASILCFDFWSYDNKYTERHCGWTPSKWSIDCSILHKSNQINEKVWFKVGTFYNNQHKLSRAFQTDMHNKLHKLNPAQ
jgi:hypothetical protein